MFKWSFCTLWLIKTFCYLLIILAFVSYSLHCLASLLFPSVIKMLIFIPGVNRSQGRGLPLMPDENKANSVSWVNITWFDYWHLQCGEDVQMFKSLCLTVFWTHSAKNLMYASLKRLIVYNYCVLVAFRNLICPRCKISRGIATTTHKCIIIIKWTSWCEWISANI